LIIYYKRVTFLVSEQRAVKQSIVGWFADSSASSIAPK
jgi:hypothetical protein